MEIRKFKCKACGAILTGENARREHCHTHHPSTALNRLDVYFRMEYREIIDDELDRSVIKKPIATTTRMIAQKGKQGNVTYRTSSIAEPESSFDCSRAIPINIPPRPRSSKDEDIFEFVVKRVASLHNGEPSLLDAKTSLQWPNICFNYPGLKTHERQSLMARIKDSFNPYFKGRGFKYSFDFEQIVRDFPHFFKGVKNKIL